MTSLCNCIEAHIENGLRLSHDETPHSGRCACGCRSDNYDYCDLSLCIATSNICKNTKMIQVILRLTRWYIYKIK
jgi:hypothetical protein